MEQNKKIKGTGFTLGYPDSKESFGLFKNDTKEKYSLYQVQVTTSSPDPRPATHTGIYFVVAASGREAEDQASTAFFFGKSEGYAAKLDGRVSTTSIRVPFLVRGWGVTTA